MNSQETLRADNVSRQFGAIKALSNVSLTIHGPQLVGILGPNGAGKTSLLDLFAGLASPSSGTLHLFGEPLDVSKYPRRRVGVVLQREFVPERLTVGEYATLFASIYAVKNGQEKILTMAALTERATVPVTRISGGEAQRLFIAAINIHEPDLLLLDEPTAQLDPQNKREIGRFLRDLSHVRTVVMTTHDLREADEICDSIIFLVAGTVKAMGPRAELIKATPNGRTIEDAFFHFCGTRVIARVL
ncbi:MAG: ABC transporter ATP-binding protein [Pseudomonadota bacterium]